MIKTSSVSNLKIIMRKYNLYPKKKWGQNFLIDENIIRKIIATASISSDDYVVEIGPGLGALTQELAKVAKGVLSIDIDKSLKEPLYEILAPYDNCQLLFADILNIDIAQVVSDSFKLEKDISYRVCANIPYNITSPIIFNLLENSSHLKSATLMMQKEVATRILAKPNSKEYGLLTIMVAYHARAELGLQISKNCFYPKPEIDSTVINLIPYDEPAVNVADEKLFKDFVKSAFQKRRKTILNISSDFFRMEKDIANNILDKVKIKPLDRPENLSIDDFANLVNAFTS